MNDRAVTVVLGPVNDPHVKRSVAVLPDLGGGVSLYQERNLLRSQVVASHFLDRWQRLIQAWRC